MSDGEVRPLFKLLCGQPEARIDLSFEAVVGPLPASARKYSAWWADEADSGRHVQARAWLNAGREVESIDVSTPTWPTAYLHGYADYLPGPANYYDEHLVDNTDCKASVWGAAGSGISTGHDLITFLHALMGGRLLPADVYQQMITPSPLDGFYGLGIIHAVDSCGGDIIGHDGAVYGYESYLYANADGTRMVAVAMPLYTIHPQIDDSLLNIVRTELCGTPTG